MLQRKDMPWRASKISTYFLMPSIFFRWWLDKTLKWWQKPLGSHRFLEGYLRPRWSQHGCHFAVVFLPKCNTEGAVTAGKHRRPCGLETFWNAVDKNHKLSGSKGCDPPITPWKLSYGNGDALNKNHHFQDLIKVLNFGSVSLPKTWTNHQNRDWQCQYGHFSKASQIWVNVDYLVEDFPH